MKRYEHGGNIYNLTGDVLDFSANINPQGLSTAIIHAIEDNLPNLVHYPDPTMHDLKSAISSHYNLPINNISCYNGATEFFYLFNHVFKPQQVLIPVPSFSEYERANQSSAVEYFKLTSSNGFKISTQLLKTKMNYMQQPTVIIANPNNPTGVLINPDELHKILDAVKSAEWIIIDESFLDFVRDSDKYTARQFMSEYDNLIVVTSLTKFYAVPSLRIGFVASNESVCNKLESAKDVWNVNLLAQVAATVALSDEDYQRKSIELISAEQEFIEMRLKNIAGVSRVYKPSANFILFKLDKSAEGLLSHLQTKNILLRSCDNFIGLDETYLRMAIRTHEENLTVLESIEEYLEDEDIEAVEEYWNQFIKE